MNHEDYHEYVLPVVHYLRGCHRLDVAWLETQLGEKLFTGPDGYFNRSYSDDFPLPQKYRDLFTAMNGPHCLTVLRVFQLKHGVGPCRK